MASHIVSSRVVLVVVPVLLAYFYGQVFQELPKYKLAIGILSARENFYQRKAIRSTWLSVLNNSDLSKDVFFRFLLTNKDCEIPTEDRRSEYVCEETSPFNSAWLDCDGFRDLLLSNDAGSVWNLKQFSPDYAAVAFDFSVVFDAIISGFSTPRNNENAVIQLWDLASDTLVVESLPRAHHMNSSLWDLRDIDSYLLPKGFVGSLIVLCGESSQCVGVHDWSKGMVAHPAIEISPLLRYSREKGEFPINILPMKLKNLWLPASLNLKFSDPHKVKRFVESKPSRRKKRKHQLHEVERELEREIDEYQDCLFLPDVDGKDLEEVYRSLPRKVASFHQWCGYHIDVDYVAKTDDDSFVDIDRLLQVLDHEFESSRPSALSWHGNFRREWVVDRFGKWAEHRYSASFYPAFACGAGNVVSRGISQLVGKNAPNLAYFQGEDVSMGIWLSAVDVEYVQDDRWICDDNCSPEMIASTQQSPATLYVLWANKRRCDNPCFC